MAILKCPSGEVEIRLRKPRPAESEAVYFDEFEKVEVIESLSLKNRCTVYIISEATSYAIEVILKKGFYLGDAEGVRVKIYDKATDGFIGQKLIPRNHSEHLQNDESTLIETVSGGIANGKWVSNAGLIFKGLAMDETLDRETDVAGMPVASLGGLQIRVSKCSEKSEVTISKREFERQMARFEGRQVISQAKNIDEVSYNKDGITHTVELSGGFAGRQVGAPTQVQMLRKETDRLCFDFICRSEEFLENNSFMKSPLPIELWPWHRLTADQRHMVFKELQKAHHHESVSNQINTGSGQNSNVEIMINTASPTAASRKEWRNMSEKDKRSVFLSLQHLRVEFESQKKHSAAKSISGLVNNQSEILTGVQLLPQAPDHTDVNASPVVRSSTPKVQTLERVVIDLTDSPPRSGQRSIPSRHLQTQAGTHSEPIDLDTFVFRSETSPTKASRSKPEIDMQRDHKRVKLHQSEGIKPNVGNDNKVLGSGHELKLRTKEIDEVAEIARLYREAEEMKAKFEELEEAKE
ncbi:hypothetical protein VTL71DRAFT_15890 [Oculimacula yallundae]|uniref:DUF7918 domain-containing protein n=1 Tax=Oculimacula yallundae TaxID=86028 RepID=A0ABR4CCX4_9HELO